MTEQACAWVQDRLPEYQRGELNAVAAGSVRAHLVTCAQCRSEAELIRVLTAPVPVPAGLEARVLSALQNRAPAPRARGPLRNYALAATLAFAALSGSLLWQQFRSDREPTAAEVDDIASLDFGWPDAGDPLLHGDIGLQALSEDQLASLLQEMGS